MNILGTIQSALTSRDGLANIGIMIGLHNFKKLITVAKWFSSKMLKPGFEKAITSRLTSAATNAGKEIGETAVKNLEETVGKTLAEKLLAKMSASTLIKSTVEKVSFEASKLAFKAVFGAAFGFISSFADAAGILGFILDVNDVAGLNEKMSQDTIDAYIMKFQTAVNAQQGVMDAGMQFPIKVYAEDSFTFQKELNESAKKDVYATDVGDYIGHLSVNSNGDAIITNFPTPLQQQNAALLAEAQGDYLFQAAGNNLQVYQRLKQDWPIIVAVAIVIIGIIVGGAFGIKALAKKKSVGKTIKP
jgi:hypothetical protein